MEIKDKDGNVIDRLFTLTDEGEEVLKGFGYGDKIMELKMLSGDKIWIRSGKDEIMLVSCTKENKLEAIITQRARE